MPIYEYYCPDNHRIYQFFAKTLTQGLSTPKCPDNPAYRMVKMLSAFSVGGGKAEDSAPADAPIGPAGASDDADDPRMEAAMSAMENEFSAVDENDPRAMGRMMRRMAELTGEKIDGEMEEVVRKLEEGADPDSLEEQLGGDNSEGEGGEFQGGPGGGPLTKEQKENAHRFRVRRRPPVRDPKLYDY